MKLRSHYPIDDAISDLERLFKKNISLALKISKYFLIILKKLAL